MRLFIFTSTSWFSHSVRNGFRGAKLLRRPLRVSHSVRNSAGCTKCFAWSAKILQGVQSDFAGVSLFSKGVRNFAPHPN